MCGRFSLVVKKKKLAQVLEIEEPDEELPELFNIAPTQTAPVITNLDPKKLTWLRWGLIPAWSKTGQPSGSTFNARMEEMADRPTFRDSFLKKRCLVVADSFYEWRAAGGNRKQPLRIFLRSGEPLVMAGLWENWSDGSEKIGSFAIVTAPPNAEMSGIHTRMPLILDTVRKRQIWLQGSTEEVQFLLAPPPDGLLDFYPVSEKINYSRAVGTVSMHDRVVQQPTLFSQSNTDLRVG